MRNDVEQLRMLIKGMREAYARGDNAMAYARKVFDSSGGGWNETIATLIAYDLQAGTYIEFARQNPEYNRQWCSQLGSILSGFAKQESSILEVGCGEATTLAGVLATLGHCGGPALGFDISWSRLAAAQQWLVEQEVEAKLFVGDLFTIPLANNSIDIVYTSHSIEPNGGRELEAITELLRVTRRWVILVEPAYELANDDARKYMDEHGYVKGLRTVAEQCGANIIEHRLLDHTANPMNPSGLLIIEKQSTSPDNYSGISWVCPVTGSKLIEEGDVYVSSETGLVYPILRGIPMLRAEHAIIASACQ